MPDDRADRQTEQARYGYGQSAGEYGAQGRPGAERCLDVTACQHLLADDESSQRCGQARERRDHRHDRCLGGQDHPASWHRDKSCADHARGELGRDETRGHRAQQDLGDDQPRQGRRGRVEGGAVGS